MELKADIKQVNVLLRWRPPHAQSKRRHPGHRVLAVVLVAAWLSCSPPPQGQSDFSAWSDCEADWTFAGVTACLEAGADVNARDADGHTPLHLVAQRGGGEAVIEVLLLAGADLNVRGLLGTPLHAAAASGNAGAAKVLIAAGADANARHARYGWTPLHVAGYGKDAGVAEALLAAGADVNARDVSGQTPLHVAMGGMAPEVSRVLLAAGADRNARNVGGETPYERGRRALNDQIALANAAQQRAAQKEPPSP